jgi:uncharacterized membrane protein
LLARFFCLPEWVRRAGVAQLLLSVPYLTGLSVVEPGLWADHFGPLLKVSADDGGDARRDGLSGEAVMGGALLLYLAVKFLHVIGAAILFGTELGIAFFLFRAERKEELQAIAATLRTVVIADYVFTTTAAIVQPLNGLALVRLGGYDLGQTWLWASLALYVLIGGCWPPVVYLQIRMRDLAQAAIAAGEGKLPQAYRSLSRIWFWLGWPAFLSMLAIFWLMVAKPA